MLKVFLSCQLKLFMKLLVSQENQDHEDEVAVNATGRHCSQSVYGNEQGDVISDDELVYRFNKRSVFVLCPELLCPSRTFFTCLRFISAVTK